MEAPLAGLYTSDKNRAAIRAFERRLFMDDINSNMLFLENIRCWNPALPIPGSIAANNS